MRKHHKDATHYSNALDYKLISGVWYCFHEDEWKKSCLPIKAMKNLRRIDKQRGGLITPHSMPYKIGDATFEDHFPLVRDRCKIIDIINPLGIFDEPELSTSGGSCNYYMVDVKNPTTLKDPYTIECNDLIESLGLSFKEANIIKEIFRTANERTNGNGKPGNTEKRAAEKVLFFAIRHAISNGVDIEKFTSDINLK